MTRRLHLLLIAPSVGLVLIAAVSCTESAAGDPLEAVTRAQPMAEAGPWNIPAETLAIGDTQHVDYTGAGPWTGSCPGGLTPGAVALKEWMYDNFPQVWHVGGFACRPNTADTSKLSVHGTGRALDLHIALDGSDADNDEGDPVGNFLIEHAEEIGIQYIIWDHLSWGGHRDPGSKTRAYTGPNPHVDHLHIELSVEGGRADTPWFTGPMDPPGEVTPCGVIAADGATVSEDGPCFHAYGPSQYWRHEDVGDGGALMWTNAFTSDRPSNWARWNLYFAEAGEYVVEVNTASGFGVYDRARYMVRHDGEESVVFADQSAVDGWQALGSFDFAAGGSQQLNLYDNVEGPVASDQHIAADAIRITRVTPEQTPDPPVVEPEPDPEPEPAPPVVEPEPDPEPQPVAEPEPDPEPAPNPSHTGKGEVNTEYDGPTMGADYEPPDDSPADFDLDERSTDKSAVVGTCAVAATTKTAAPALVVGVATVIMGLTLFRLRR